MLRVGLEIGNAQAETRKGNEPSPAGTPIDAKSSFAVRVLVPGEFVASLRYRHDIHVTVIVNICRTDPPELRKRSDNSNGLTTLIPFFGGCAKNPNY